MKWKTISITCAVCREPIEEKTVDVPDNVETIFGVCEPCQEKQVGDLARSNFRPIETLRGPAFTDEDFEMEEEKGDDE